MDNGHVYTPIGMFDVNKLGEGYVCKEEIGVTFGRDIIIKSCFTRVVVINGDGTEEAIEPVVTESCMNPGTKVVIPITYKAVLSEGAKRGDITISNRYRQIVIGADVDESRIRTEYFEPKLEEKSCAECQNCGRC